MKVLFLGGTGNISSACVERALERGHQVSIYTRGHHQPTFSRPVTAIQGDRHDAERLRDVARDGKYDVVTSFIGFTPDEVALDIDAFHGQVGQYIHISTASAYQKPPTSYLITESTPLHNPYWKYSQDKIACERALVDAYRQLGFPVTIVRPSYTYGTTWIPSSVGGHGYTVLHRMRTGKPIISHGDGSSLWVMTHTTDFAVGLVGLFGLPQALGQAYHITGDEVLTWDQIYRTTAAAAGVDIELVHIPTDLITALAPDWGANLKGDKAHSVVFDNTKIKRAVPAFRATLPFAEGIRQSIAWYDAEPSRRVVDEEVDRRMDVIVDAYGRLFEQITETNV
ncbi:MAG: SDR family oxidoreductase [Anaerolineae bacterium]